MRLDLGGMTVEWLGKETFHLDAGAMFGPVPRLLWTGRYPADADNLAPFVATPLLVRTADRNIVVDTGLGNRLPPKVMRNFRVENVISVPDALRMARVAPADIDTVILTHLDWDHAAGIIQRTDAGLRLRYPNATHIINRTEWLDTLHPNSRSKNTYWPENLKHLAEVGDIRFVDATADICRGIRVFHTGGHTRGHMIVELRGSNQTAYHLADLLPTHAHTNPLWVTAYDNFPLDSVTQKEHWLGKARRQGNWLLLYHDAIYAAIRLDPEGNISDTLARQ